MEQSTHNQALHLTGLLAFACNRQVSLVVNIATTKIYGSSGLSVLLGIAQYHTLENEANKPKAVLCRFGRIKYFLSPPSFPLKKGREKKMQNEKYSTSKVEAIYRMSSP